MVCLCSSGSCQLAAKKIANGSRNFLSMRLQREVPRVVKMHFGGWVVPPKGLGARRKEERIVLAPDSQNGRPFCAEVFLELGIQGYVAGVIQEQIELDLIIAGSSQES